MSKEAINAAIEALKASKHGNCDHAWADEAIAGLQALAEQPAPAAQQEPVAWLYPEGLKALQDGKCWTAYPTKHEDCIIPLHTAPQAQPAPDEGTLAQEVIGCFNAALIEGLQEALAETTDEHLKDLVERRLMYALYAAQETTPQAPKENNA